MKVYQLNSDGRLSDYFNDRRGFIRVVVSRENDHPDSLPEPKPVDLREW